ncbi:probable peptidyl-tRNA hydrolase 2 [Lingula anatina]|uniref:peptidyl-tRNA hydrolase n=1 Tax=Lingula anatina TaxID=7574 RepID=A0A1S3KBV2_LINAN|nr:probable peptidyl-tRNA hydrolase 2 [Lingula anatina]|eukprot:XP_013420113.1 probable peptidyl-tRNA hydrolase 2 [Lingula anatina]
MSDDGATAGAEGDWVPKEELIQLLTNMGVSRNAAIKALFHTGNYSADLAAAWIFENQDQDLDAPFDFEEGSSDSSEDEIGDYIAEGDFHKMVFVVNSELNMGVGKVAAQVAHAALGIHRLILDNQQKFGEMLLHWEQYGETKIVLKGTNKEELIALAVKAEALGLPNYIVQDAGRTQIASGSVTVLGIFGKIKDIDQVTGQLKLL